MSEDFFQKKSYCDFCPLEKDIKANKLKRASQRKEVQIKSDVSDYSNIDYLFLTDCVERPEDFSKLFKLLQNKGIKNFVLTSAIGCRTVSFELPKPMYSTYTYCNSFDIKKFNPKVVFTFGKAFMYFTKSSVFDSWREFREFIFNETYFYPHIKSEWKGRIYPCAFIHDLFQFDTFEHLHFTKNIEFAKKHIENYENEKFIMPEYKIEKVENLDRFIEEHKDEKKGAFDTETNSLNVFIDDFKLGSIQCSFDGITGYYIPEKSITNKRKLSIWLNNIYQIWANGKYDCKVLNRVGIQGYHVDEDIPLIFHLMNTERDSNSIKVLSWLIGFGGYEDELDEYKKKYKIKNYLDIPEHIMMNYAGLDGIVTYKLEQFLQKYLLPRQQDTYNLYREVIIPVIPVFQEIEENGILVDKEYIQNYHNELMIKKEKVEQEIYRIVGKEFNIASNDELGKTLKDMGLPNYGETKKGLYQTNEEILLRWEKDGYEIIKKLLEYRKISKLDSTYVGNEKKEDDGFDFFNVSKKNKEKDNDGIFQYVMSDNKIHGSIMPAMAGSWRSLSFKPNLQNFPKQGEEGKAFRKVFIAPEDYYFCEADYSGFQLRLMGIYSGDETMLDAFINKGGDLHSVTGCEVFAQGTDLEYFMKHKKEEPYKTARFNGKTTNLAFAFCQSSFSFQNKIREEWTEEQIDDYIKNNKLEIHIDSKTGQQNKYLTIANDINKKYFIKFPRIKQYAEKMHNFAKQNGYVDCPIFPGLRRHLPEMLKQGQNLSKEKLSYYSSLNNITSNTGAQGGESLIINKALVKIHTKMKPLHLKSKLIGHVHDSIVLYIHKSEVEQMYHILKDCMEVFDYSIPILAEIELGSIWGFGEEVTEKNIDQF